VTHKKNSKRHIFKIENNSKNKKFVCFTIEKLVKEFYRKT